MLVDHILDSRHLAARNASSIHRELLEDCLKRIESYWKVRYFLSNFDSLQVLAFLLFKEFLDSSPSVLDEVSES